MSRNFLPAIAHRLTGNTSHKRGGAMPRFRVFVILASPRENFGARSINGIWRCLRTSHDANDAAAFTSTCVFCPTQHPIFVHFSSFLPLNTFNLLLIVRRGLLSMSMDNSLKLQKRFRWARRRAIRRFSETIEFQI